MAKSPRVFTHCRWDCNRIAILFIDKELSIDITLEEAKELFSSLRKRYRRVFFE